jgi:hypothetical protein
MAGLVVTRILIDGAILTAVLSAALVLMLYLKPRLALSDYPEDVKAAVPPRTRSELRLGVALAIPMLIVAVGIPLYSAWLVRAQSGGDLTYGTSFAIILGELMLFSAFDLIVLDVGMFYTWTPKFLVLPGTEGMAGYKDWRPHVRAQLTTGSMIVVIASAVLAAVPALVW